MFFVNDIGLKNGNHYKIQVFFYQNTNMEIPRLQGLLNGNEFGIHIFIINHCQ